MVVLDQWGSLWGNVFRAETRSWHGWRQSGGGLVGSPAIAVDANNTAWVVVRSTYNALWLTSLAPTGFSGSWTSLAGIVDGDPAITITSTGMAYIVARDDIGRVWLVRAQNGVSQGWSLLGGVILGDPAVVAGLNGTAHVIARDPNTYPWVATINGTTPTWKGIATALDSPAAGIHVDNVVTVTAIRGGQVWSAPFFVASESWGTWSPLGQAATSASAASDETRLMVAARDPAGQLVWYKAGMGWSNYGTSFAGGALSATPTGSSLSDTDISTSPGQLQNCIGSTGTARTCVLAQGRHPVNTPLRIQRSGITVMGWGGPGDTTVYRNHANVVQIMVADANVSDVTIKNLTFDGNRYGPGLGLNCLPGNAHFYDLDLSSGGKFTVQWANFINAPGWALIFKGYGSSVSLSNFGRGGHGYAPDGSLRDLTEQESATRSTAIWIEGSYNGAWYNAISHAGTAAINLHGSHQYAYGNLLYQNRYEISDGVGGGQLFLDRDSSAATVTGNVIDGNQWPPYVQGQPPPGLATGCQLPNIAQFNAGVEAYGWDHYFFNNEIERHTGSGMQLAGSNPTGRITISSQNPSDPSDTPRYIEMNKAGGIVFLGPYWSPEWPLAAQGVALYKVNVRNNARFDVTLDGLSNDSTPGYYGVYHGFVSDSCIIPGIPSDEYRGPVAGIPGVNGGLPPPHPNTLSYPLPTSYGGYPPNGTCPDPGWPAQTPAKSNIPGWRW